MWWLASKLLDPRVLIGLAISIAVAFAAGWLRHSGFKAGAASVQSVLDRERRERADEKVVAAQIAADWEAKARAADARERDRERMWNDVARSIDRDGTQNADKLRAAVARASAAGLGLSAELDAARADAARASEAGASAADARQRAATAETARVFTELLGRCHERGRARASFAEQAAAAGSACERWAEALENPPAAP